MLYEPCRARAAPAVPAGVYLGAVPALTEQVGTIADRFFGAPSQALTVAGITGTNGKTTCAWLLAQALTHCRRPAAYIGTLGYGRPPQVSADAAHDLRCGHAAAPAGAAARSWAPSACAWKSPRTPSTSRA